MNETGIFFAGFGLGAVSAVALLVLFGQWLFATGSVFMAKPDDEQREDDERERNRAERRLLSLAERGIAVELGARDRVLRRSLRRRVG